MDNGSQGRCLVFHIINVYWDHLFVSDVGFIYVWFGPMGESVFSIS